MNTQAEKPKLEKLPNGMFLHHASGAMLFKELAQPHVESFAGCFPDWVGIKTLCKDKSPFAAQTITGQNIAGNLWENVKDTMSNRPTRNHPDATMKVGPFCSSRDAGKYFYVRCADWVLSRIRERTIIIPDTVSFELVDRENGWTLVIASHSSILGSVWLAYIRTDTIPDLLEFKCSFKGRKVGAIGVFHNCTVDVVAAGEESAKLACYSTHEHISEFKCQEAQ